MPDVINCPSCENLMVRNKFRDVCENCWKEEEKQFDIVYKFIRIRENRTATIPQVIEGTNVDEGLLLKFIKTGRLKIIQFPNLGYPCDSCGTIIRTGKLCDSCASNLREALEIHEKEEERKEELRRREKGTYLSGGNKER
jgi:flagellar operon protein (TIGR03826 family)